MIDAQLLRRDPDFVFSALERRMLGQTFLDRDRYSKLEQTRKSAQVVMEGSQAEINAMNKMYGIELAKLKKTHLESGQNLGQSMMMIQSAHIASVDRKYGTNQRAAREFEDVDRQLSEMLAYVPNLPHESVPSGYDETCNKKVRSWGSQPAFDFTLRDHVDIGLPLGLEIEMGVKLSGSRFSFLRGPVAGLHRALTQFMLDLHTSKHGYTECYTPYIVNREILEGTRQLPKFKNDMFWINRGEDATDPSDAVRQEQYLISTSEITLTNTVRDAIADAADLPIKLTAHSPCFRSEAGSHRRDERGLIRQHQFDKVEMVQIAHPDRSYEALELMVGHAEAVLQHLELPYKVMLLCSGELGFAAAKTYDLEVWFPAQNAFREISSCSNCEDFQARSMQARFRAESQGKPQLVHTLNGSGLAVGRTLAALLENHQRADGGVNIPKALQPYLGGLDVLRST